MKSEHALLRMLLYYAVIAHSLRSGQYFVLTGLELCYDLVLHFFVFSLSLKLGGLQLCCRSVSRQEIHRLILPTIISLE